jgi:endonuclease YncB( thermonuclease family)
MQRFPQPRKIWQAIVLALGVIAVVVVRMNRSGPNGHEGVPHQQSGKSGRTEDRTSAKAGRWQRLENCTLVEDKNNDGDSFILRHGGEQTTFRLYFADCPEKRRHQYNGDRIAQQGAYFGGLNETATLSVGQEARDFAFGLLRKGPVTVDTCWEQVYEPGRRYAFVHAGGVDLAEALVSRGLARIYTAGASVPGGRSRQDEKARLQQLEREAKAKRLGGWGRK